MIKEVQYCLGMESKYQTGNFGPITAEKIQSWSKENNKPVFVGKFTDNPNATNVGAQVGISKETYDFIIKNTNGNHGIFLSCNNASIMQSLIIGYLFVRMIGIGYFKIF